jgi:RHS repeat-associated protein
MRHACWLLLLFAIGFGGVADAQSATPQVARGTPPFGSFAGGPDIVNLGNLNAHYTIPVLSRAGRGSPFSYNLAYDTSVWYPSTSSGTTSWTPVSNWGWTGTADLATPATGRLTSQKNTLHCTSLNTYSIYWWTYTDKLGVPHPFLDESQASGLCGPASFVNEAAADGSGYFLSVTGAGPGTVTWRSGTVLGTTGALTDNNGNKITVSGSNIYDTLSSTTAAVSASGTPSSSPVKYAYTNSQNTLSYVTVAYKSHTVQTAFACSGVTEYNQSNIPLVDTVTLPDGGIYGFTYEATPGNSANVTGRLQTITLPSGGSITYTYTGGSHGIVCADGSAAAFSRALSPGGTWTYARSQVSGSHWQTTVTTPPDPSVGNDTVIDFQKDSASTTNFYEVQRQAYQGSSISGHGGTLLLTTLKCYNKKFGSCVTTGVSTGITQIDTYQELPNGKTSAEETQINGYGLTTSVLEYDFGVTAGSAPSSTLLKRGTSTSYASLGGGKIVDHPSQITLNNGTTIQSQTTYTYDESAVTATSGTPQLTTPPYGARGNVTTLKSLTSVTSAISKHFTYYDTGNVNTATDVNSAVTTTKYGACGNSFLTEIDYPLSLISYSTWDTNCAGGVIVSSNDVNGNQTTYTYDSNVWRLTNTTYPDGGSTTVTYNFGVTSPWNVTTSSKQTSTANVTGETILDGLGRVKQKQLTSDPVSTDFIDYTYDILGRLGSVSNPYRTTTDPTYGVTTYGYDALNHITTLTHPDSSQAKMTYTGGAVETVDEGNNSGGSTHVTKVYQNDGLGRLVSVCEVSGVTQVGSSGTPASCGQDIAATGFLTSYTYWPLGEISSVAQNGSSSRTYTYDGLGRITQEWNPESGSTTYSYDTGTAGDLYQRTRPKPNQTGTATVVTSYGFDALHRMTTTSYNDGSTASVLLSYDEASNWGNTLNDSKGHLTHAVAANFATGAIFSYDTMGRVAEEWQCTPVNCGTNDVSLTFGYDALGETTSLVNSQEGITYTYGYDSAAHLTHLQSSLVDTNHPATLLTVNTYNPLGEVQKSTLGNGIVRTLGYDKRGRLTSVADGSLYSLTLGYTPNSDVLTGSDSVNGNWSYSYDDFNRLSASNKNSGQQTFSYAYDRYSNRWQQNAPQGGPAPQYSFNTNNQISGSGVVYDAAGNVSNDGLGNSFTYDGENRMITVSGSNPGTYVYDAFGNRVRSTVNSTPYDFIFLGTQAIDKVTASSWVWGHPGGMMGVTYTNSSTYFDHNDWLGTVRARTSVSGSSVENCTSLGFGDALTCTGTDYSPLHYTGALLDSESNLHHFPARQLSTTEGRWTSPDPLGIGAVDPATPQTWNRYAYVTNNPLSFTDPTGRNLKGPSGGCNSDVMNCYGGGGTGEFGSGGGFGTGTDGNGFSWNSGPGSFGGPGNPYGLPSGTGALQAGVSRYLSIITTGWDPALGINWNNVNYRSQANGQYKRLSGNLSVLFGDTASADPTNCNLIGGHCNFALTCADWSSCGPGRYDGGVHIENVNGGLWVHDDTVSPWTGPFSTSALLTGNFWEHGFVDLIGGTFFVGAFPQ